MTTTTDMERAIGDYLHDIGLIPEGGMVVEVDYVAVARVRVLDGDGFMCTSYEHLHSDRVEACAHEGMVARALRHAQDRNR